MAGKRQRFIGEPCKVCGTRLRFTCNDDCYKCAMARAKAGNEKLLGGRSNAD